MNHNQAELHPGIPSSVTSGAWAQHLSGSRTTGGPVPCTIECENCPWVDFRDYDQCGLTYGRQSLEVIAAS